MQRAMKLCAHVGCNTLTRERWCAHHKTIHEQQQKQSRNQYQRDEHDREYHTARWQRFRAWFLRRHPICSSCEAQGRIEPATVPHHIVPVKQGGAMYDEGNLAALCRTCHEVIEGRKKG